MAKTIAVSVSEALFKRMKKWKGSFKPSKIFQDAVSLKIDRMEKYEDFKSNVNGGIDMAAVIEKLRKQKEELESEFCEKGKKNGYRLAPHLDFKDLQYAESYQTANAILKKGHDGAYFQHDPTDDEIFGGAFIDILELDVHLGFDESVSNRFGFEFPNKNLRDWEEGFIAGILEFWDEVKDKL